MRFVDADHFVVTLTAGKTYFWCSCGRSASRVPAGACGPSGKSIPSYRAHAPLRTFISVLPGFFSIPPTDRDESLAFADVRRRAACAELRGQDY